MTHLKEVKTGKFFYLGKEYERQIHHDELVVDGEVLGWIRNDSGFADMVPNLVLIDAGVGPSPVRELRDESIAAICRRMLNLIDVAKNRRLGRSPGIIDTSTDMTEAIGRWGRKIRRKIA